MSNMNFTQRDFRRFDIPLNENVEILHPENAHIRLHGPGYSQTIDLGALCFRDRQFECESSGKKYRRPQGKARPVDISTLDKARIPQVRRLIAAISNLITVERRRHKSVFTKVSRFHAFIDWADENGYFNAMLDESEAHIAFNLYLELQLDLLKKNKIKLRTVARRMRELRAFIRKVFVWPNFAHDSRLPKEDHSQSEPTEPPSETDQARMLALCRALFNQLSELTVGYKQYPFAVTMPEVCEWPNNTMWVFPSESWCMPHTIGDERWLRHRSFIAYDYENGRLHTGDELKTLQQMFKKDTRVKLILERAAKHVEKANTEKFNHYRLRAAQIAQKAFMILFCAVTPLNWAQILELEWAEDEKYEAQPVRQGFRRIKWRAQGRIVNVEIPLGFMPEFKKFLKLRKYILNGAMCKFLFVSRGKSNLGTPGPMQMHISDFLKSLIKADSKLEKIGSRKWRAAMSDWLVISTNIDTAAQILQNTADTVKRRYAAGSDSKTKVEMSSYFDGVLKVVLPAKARLKATENAAGKCGEIGRPVQNGGFDVMKADCKTVEGCLFCEKYRLHSDEQDTKKLVSCKYYVERLAGASGAEAAVEPVLTRIDFYLGKIESNAPGLVTKIKNEVYVKGALTNFFATKMTLLMNLGVL